MPIKYPHERPKCTRVLKVWKDRSWVDRSSGGGTKAGTQGGKKGGTWACSRSLSNSSRVRGSAEESVNPRRNLWCRSCKRRGGVAGLSRNGGGGGRTCHPGGGVRTPQVLFSQGALKNLKKFWSKSKCRRTFKTLKKIP